MCLCVYVIHNMQAARGRERLHPREPPRPLPAVIILYCDMFYSTLLYSNLIFTILYYTILYYTIL